MLHTSAPTAAEAQWVLHDKASTWLTWGTDADEVWNTATPATSGVKVDTQRATLSTRRGVSVGRDVLRGFTIDFEMFFNGDTPAEAVERWEAFAGVWHRGMELPARTVWELAKTYGGRTLTCVGRPAAIEANFSEVHVGAITAKAQFEASLPFWFGATAPVVSVAATTTGSERGIVFPLRFPWSTEVPEDFAVDFVSPAVAYPTFTIKGPAQNPIIKLGDVEVRLLDSIAPGDSVVITTLPTLRGVRRSSDGANLANRLDAAYSRIDQLVIAPGANRAVCTASGIAAGVTTLEITYRPTVMGG